VVLRIATGLLVLFLCCGAASPPTALQEDPGEPGVITGTVVDGAGRPVGGAKVWIQERGRPRTGALHSVATDKQGYFRIAYLRVGIYDVFASAERPPAFLSKPLKSIRLTDDKPERHVTLRLGSSDPARGYQLEDFIESWRTHLNFSLPLSSSGRNVPNCV